MRTPDRVRVNAEIIRVFRGEPRLVPGDRVHFSVSVLTGDEELDRVPIGGSIWTNYAALQSARFLEAFLDGTPPDCEIRLWQLAILDTPTDRPTMVVQAAVVNSPLSWLWRSMSCFVRIC